MRATIIVTLFACFALFSSTYAASADDTYGWKGCDGKAHLYHKINGSCATCMNNGRIGHCSEAVTKEYCQKKGVC
jgi:hypothetical protein